jgi:translation elongation factor EF-Tu-like GTPase
MAVSAPHAEVELSFLTPEQGGRTRPFRTGYRPPFYYEGRYWDAFLHFETDGWIEPGNTVRASVSFLTPEAHRDALFPGKEFELRDPPARTVARGRILRLFW